MRLKDIVLGIAIIILTIFVTWYGISMFYPNVEYGNYCTNEIIQKTIITEENCISAGGKWYAYEEPIQCVTAPCAQGWCDTNYECSQEYENAKEQRSKIIFFISIPLGILIIFLGAILFSLESVGVGLMGGGIGTLVYGAGGYWKYGGDWFRFVISFIGLIAVIYLAYWFEKKFNKKKKRKK